MLLKSPPAINFEHSVWKNVSNCSFFKLCRGGQYTAATVISYRSPCTLMDVACMASSSYINCSYYVIVSFISIAVPPWAVPSG